MSTVTDKLWVNTAGIFTHGVTRQCVNLEETAVTFIGVRPITGDSNFLPVFVNVTGQTSKKLVSRFLGTTNRSGLPTTESRGCLQCSYSNCSSQEVKSNQCLYVDLRNFLPGTIPVAPLPSTFFKSSSPQQPLKETSFSPRTAIPAMRKVCLDTLPILPLLSNGYV